MSTNRARSFGLAIIVAIGVIAAMAAMGLFSTGPAHAENHWDLQIDGVKFTPPSLDIRAPGEWTVAFTRGDDAADLALNDTIVITFPEGVVVPDTTALTAEGVTITLTVGTKTYEPGVSSSNEDVTLTLPAVTADAPSQLRVADTVTVTFPENAGFMNPPTAGEAIDTTANADAQPATEGLSRHRHCRAGRP